MVIFFFKQKTAYEMRISDWSSDVCSSDLLSLVTDEGARDWLWEQGFSLVQDLSVQAEDTGDSTMMACELDIYLPDSAMQQILEAAKNPTPPCATYRNG